MNLRTALQSLNDSTMPKRWDREEVQDCIEQVADAVHDHYELVEEVLREHREHHTEAIKFCTEACRMAADQVISHA